MNAAITGVGGYVPDYRLTNEELSKMVDTSDEWIMSHVGIKERRILKGENQGSSVMGAAAVEDLVKKEVDRTVEDIVKKQLNEAFLQFIQSMSEQKFSLAQMTTLSKRSEDEVISALKKLGLPIPE